MVNTKDFGIRIQKIMDYYGVSASSFADYLGVGRSSISHILSGRNKPSLDFVMKIIEAYTDVDLHWLLYGKGTFPKSDEPVIEKIKKENPNTSFMKPPDASSIPTEIKQDLFSQSEDVRQTMEPSIVNSSEQDSTPIAQEEKIERIVIFYTNGTFSTYQIKKT